MSQLTTKRSFPTSPQRRQFQHKPKRAIPDHGCHGYDLHGVMFTRCQSHAPAGGRDLGAVLGACVTCVMGATQ